MSSLTKLQRIALFTGLYGSHGISVGYLAAIDIPKQTSEMAANMPPNPQDWQRRGKRKGRKPR